MDYVLEYQANHTIGRKEYELHWAVRAANRCGSES